MLYRQSKLSNIKLKSSLFSTYLSLSLLIFYFESWDIQCDFIKKVYSEFIKEEKIDGNIYTKGGRGMRTILSTKFGKKSYLMPTENDQ